MELLYISSFMFEKENDEFFGLPSCSNSFFEKYLDVFEKIKVLGENFKKYLDLSSLVKIDDKKIRIKILPANTHPKDFKNDKKIKKMLFEEIYKADAILIKPSSRKGIMAIKIAKQLKKPYMIELTGDIHNALKRNPNFLKKLYAPILYWNIKRHIKKCKFGLYVSKYYLQSQFPINGLMCGCSDVELKDFREEIINKRIQRITTKDFKNDCVDLGLIGFYQGKMKGVDCAIRALSHLPQNYNLTILGNGTEENRQKWYRYAEKRGVKNRLKFEMPLKSSKEVCNWLDKIDFFVFPTKSEGLPRVIVEAMSRGLVCFASNICTLPELLDNNCLFKLNDDLELSRLIKFYSKNRLYQIEQSKRNFETSKQYQYDLLKNKRNEFLKKFKEYCENTL